MAQYLLSVWHDEDYIDAFETTPPEVIERLHAQVGALNADMEKKAKSMSINALHAGLKQMGLWPRP